MTFCFRLRPKWRRLVADDWCDLNRQKKARDTNFHRLIRLKALSRLLTAKLTRLVGRLAVTDFKGQDALRDAAMREAKIHIPATEVANIPRLNSRSGRATTALLALGPIGGFLCPGLFRTSVLIETTKQYPSFRETTQVCRKGTDE